MRNAPRKAVQADEDDMRAEYDFTGGVRGKHYHAMRAGYTITIRKSDGTTVIKEVKPRRGAIVLEPDVRRYFPDSKSDNTALRSLIRLIAQKRRPLAKRAPGAIRRRRPAAGD